jgi:quercetin dioxygenase-like cupin family protein
VSCGEELDLDLLARDSLRFRRRVVELAPGEDLDIDADPWRESLVLVEGGEVELECAAGERSSFAAGAVLCLPPPVRSLRNSGSEPARLIAISRRARKRSKLTG